MRGAAAVQHHQVDGDEAAMVDVVGDARLPGGASSVAAGVAVGGRGRSTVCTATAGHWWAAVISCNCVMTTHSSASDGRVQ